jgi:hypothetical protein
MLCTYMVVGGGRLRCNMMLPLDFMRLMRRRAFNCLEKYGCVCVCDVYGNKWRKCSVSEKRFTAWGPIKCCGVANWINESERKSCRVVERELCSGLVSANQLFMLGNKLKFAQTEDNFLIFY